MLSHAGVKMAELSGGWTVRALQARSMGVDGICDAPDCRGFFSYDLETLGEGFGLDTPLPTAVARGCPRCGADLRVVFSVGGTAPAAGRPS